MLIEHSGLKILTDPGLFNLAEVADINGVDVLLVTHEHGDHLHIEAVKTILKNNPNIRVVTNKAVGAILEKENVKHEIVAHNQSATIKGVLIEGFGQKHAEIYKQIGQVENTGYFIAEQLFYPGDALTNPGKPVEILAAPIAGPWIKISEAVKYILEIHPKACFPVHEAIASIPQFYYGTLQKALEGSGITAHIFEKGQSREF